MPASKNTLPALAAASFRALDCRARDFILDEYDAVDWAELKENAMFREDLANFKFDCVDLFNAIWG